MREWTIFGIASLFVTVVAHATPPEKPGSAQFKYVVVVFDHEANRVICEGRISARQFQKWFKRDYAVGGEQVEVPQNATALGALILSDGDEILVMPLYRWGSETVKYFACQSHTIGRAPMFHVLKKSEEEFFRAVKSALAELSRAEPSDPARGALPRR